MYEDNNVARYYDDSLVGTYKACYTLFLYVLIVLGGIAIAVPLAIRTMS